eukprot:349939-Chlamydomonas_euryale.AAC.2
MALRGPTSFCTWGYTMAKMMLTADHHNFGFATLLAPLRSSSSPGSEPMCAVLYFWNQLPERAASYNGPGLRGKVPYANC